MSHVLLKLNRWKIFREQKCKQYLQKWGRSATWKLYQITIQSWKRSLGGWAEKTGNLTQLNILIKKKKKSCMIMCDDCMIMPMISMRGYSVKIMRKLCRRMSTINWQQLSAINYQQFLWRIFSFILNLVS